MLFDDTRRPPPAGKQIFFRFIYYLSELNHVSQPLLQSYDVYHERYLKWGCQKQHNTTFFNNCCHPLLVRFCVAILGSYSHTTQKGEPISVLENLGCKATDDECDDGDSSAPPSSTPSTPPQSAHADTYPTATPSSSSKPESAALAKGNDSPSPSSSPQLTAPTSTPIKSSTSPPPAQTGGSGSNGNEVHTGGKYVPWSLFSLIYSLCLPRGTFYYQNGVAGACGQVHSDSDFICAMGECPVGGPFKKTHSRFKDSAIYGGGELCGKKVQITNLGTKETITVVVADECPTCENPNSIDLSFAAFGAFANHDAGVVDITWEFV